MDGGYYKAFQKRLSRPQPPIFNKIFSQTRKQSEAFPARPNGRNQPSSPAPRAVIHLRLKGCRCRNKGAAGQSEVPREGPAHVRAGPRSMLHSGIFSRERMGHFALRHIAALEQFAALNQCRLFPDKSRLDRNPLCHSVCHTAPPLGNESASSLPKRRISSRTDHGWRGPASPLQSPLHSRAILAHGKPCKQSTGFRANLQVG